MMMMILFIPHFIHGPVNCYSARNVADDDDGDDSGTVFRLEIINGDFYCLAFPL